MNTRLLKMLCPYHKEKTPSFVLNKVTREFKCFGCGKSGTLSRGYSLDEEDPVRDAHFEEIDNINREEAGLTEEDYDAYI